MLYNEPKKSVSIYLSIQQYGIKICKISEWEILFHVFQKLTSKKKKKVVIQI